MMWIFKVGSLKEKVRQLQIARATARRLRLTDKIETLKRYIVKTGKHHDETVMNDRQDPPAPRLPSSLKLRRDRPAWQREVSS